MLTILCATKFDRVTAPTLRGLADVADTLSAEFVVLHGLTHADYPRFIDVCRGDYILWMDDDEACSQKMVQWLREERYTEVISWCFPRVWLFPDEQHYLSTPPHWPDYQHRLGRRAFARNTPQHIHGGWLPGLGLIAPVDIEHYKLVQRTIAERQETVRLYDHTAEGAGMPRLYLPEFSSDTVAAPYNRIGSTIARLGVSW